MKTLLALLILATPAAAQEITRTYASPTAAIAQVVRVPPGFETIYLSGVLPDLPQGAPAPNTEVQAESAFAKIDRILAANGLTAGDVVSMTIYLVADPANQGRMDFAGMMRSYGKHYGTPAQPNRPSRSTVQVSALAGPGFLIEVEVTAAKKPSP